MKKKAIAKTPSPRQKPPVQRSKILEPNDDANDLPEGWTKRLLKEIGTWRTGGTPSRSKSEYFGDGISWVKSGDLPDGPILRTEEQITHIGLENSAAKVMPPGTICMALYGATIGKLGIMTFEAATNQASANLVPDNRLVEGKFVFFYLLSQRQKFIELGQGGAQPNISQEIVRNHPILFPPLSEQRRIVAKLESVLGTVTMCRERLSRIPTLLKRFRQSVLAAACSGKLTEDWRENHRSLSSAETSGEHRFEIPESWTFSAVRDVLEGLKYGTSQKCDYSQQGVPVLRIPNISDGIIECSDMKYARLDTSEYEQLRLRPGDVLMIRSNGSVSLVGKTAIAKETEKDFAYAGYLIRLRPNIVKIVPEFLNLVLSSYDVRLQIELNARSTSGVNNINSEEAKSLQIPLPPLPEQREIVRRVEALFAYADRIESRLTVAQANVEKLTQSVLAKAFRGELVPTDAELERNRPAKKMSRCS